MRSGLRGFRERDNLNKVNGRESELSLDESEQGGGGIIGAKTKLFGFGQPSDELQTLYSTHIHTGDTSEKNKFIEMAAQHSELKEEDEQEENQRIIPSQKVQDNQEEDHNSYEIPHQNNRKPSSQSNSKYSFSSSRDRVSMESGGVASRNRSIEPQFQEDQEHLNEKAIPSTGKLYQRKASRKKTVIEGLSNEEKEMIARMKTQQPQLLGSRNSISASALLPFGRQRQSIRVGPYSEEPFGTRKSNARQSIFLKNPLEFKSPLGIGGPKKSIFDPQLIASSIKERDRTKGMPLLNVLNQQRRTSKMLDEKLLFNLNTAGSKGNIKKRGQRMTRMEQIQEAKRLAMGTFEKDVLDTPLAENNSGAQSGTYVKVRNMFNDEEYGYYDEDQEENGDILDEDEQEVINRLDPLLLDEYETASIQMEKINNDIYQKTYHAQRKTDLDFLQENKSSKRSRYAFIKFFILLKLQ